MAVNAFPDTYVEQIGQEVHQTPGEYLPMLLQIVRAFRESVTMKPAADSFRQGWKETLQGETFPVTELWDGIDGP